MKNVTAIKWDGLAVTAQYHTEEEALNGINRMKGDRWTCDGRPFIAVFIVDSETGEAAMDHEAYIPRFNLLGKEALR